MDYQKINKETSQPLTIREEPSKFIENVPK